MVSAATVTHPLDLRLLGPVEARVEGRLVSLGGPRQVGVLARLMLTPQRLVSMGQLVDSVWDGDEPAQPHVAVRSYVSNLRRALEPHRRRRSADSCITGSAAGYTLQVAPAAVDHVRFESLIHVGRAHLAAAEPTSAITDLGDALSLWRGEPCTGLSSSEVFTACRSQFAQLRDTAWELLFEAQLARGDHLSVVATIEGAIAESPLRERLTELAMVAFYRAGRQTDALALGQRLRARLRDELGVDPSPEVGELEVKILNHDKSLWPAMPSRSGSAPARSPVREPVERASVATGQAQLPPPSAPAGAPEVAAETDLDPAAVEQRAHPADPGGTSPLVGRTSQLAVLSAVTANVRAGRGATAIVTGEPGVGKTALVRAMVEAAGADGIPVAWARSLEGETTPLWPWSQAIVGLMETLRETSIGPPRPDSCTGLLPLRALGPSVTTALGLPPADGDDERTVGGGAAAPPVDTGEVLLTVTRLLQQIARTTPLILIFEDLQWTDLQTVALLRFAASTLADQPVAFVVTWCPTELDSDQRSVELRSLARLPSVVRIDLEGIDEQVTAELARRAGHELSTEELRDLHRRCGGSPYYALELLAGLKAGPGVGAGGVAPGPNLIDAVMARVERLHPQAAQVLGVAALFRVPFSVEQLIPLCGVSRVDVHAVIGAAVRGAVLGEVKRCCDRYRFRYPLIVEVLVDQLLSTERAAHHRAIGHHLLALDGPGYEAAYHLSHGGSESDQVVAAEIALDLFDRDPDCTKLGDIDGLVGRVLAGGEAAAPLSPTLSTDARLYTSWRAWLDRRVDDWRAEAHRALQAALQLVECDGPAASEPTGPESSIDRLGRAALGLVGFPAYHPGPIADPFVEESISDRLAELGRVAALLPTDHASHWVVQMQLVHLKEISARAGASASTKALRKAKQVAANARRKVTSGDAATVLCIMLKRFGDRLDPQERLDVVAEIGQASSGLGRELFLARWSYPALMTLGRRADAEQAVQSIWAKTKTIGDQIHVAEARALRIMHLLWTAQLDEAEDQILRGIAEWKQLGLRGSATFGHQHYHLRRLQGRPVDPDGTIGQSLPLRFRPARPARTALLLAELGQPERARDHLDSAVEAMVPRPWSACDLAELAGAAALVEHSDAGRLALERLTPLGDRLILFSDRFTILGPASFYAGLAASATGDVNAASMLLDAALSTVMQSGGSTVTMRALLEPVKNRINPSSSSNSAPIQPQSSSITL